MAKLTMICEGTIGELVVETPGLYAWRNKNLPPEQCDTAWFFGILRKGEKIDGQYEGTGPITYSSTICNND